MSLNIPKPEYSPPMPEVKSAMSNYELKPCPFCGNTYEYIKIRSLWQDNEKKIP